MINDIESVSSEIELPGTVQKVPIFIKKLDRRGRVHCRCLCTVSDLNTPGCYVIIWNVHGIVVKPTKESFVLFQIYFIFTTCPLMLAVKEY